MCSLVSVLASARAFAKNKKLSRSQNVTLMFPVCAKEYFTDQGHQVASLEIVVIDMDRLGSIKAKQTVWAYPQPKYTLQQTNTASITGPALMQSDPVPTVAMWKTKPHEQHSFDNTARSCTYPAFLCLPQPHVSFRLPIENLPC